jgi:uncharacterized protein (TIGR03118 family)
MLLQNRTRVLPWAVLLCALGLIPAFADNNDFYEQTNLVSDVPKLAQRLDPKMVNAWGIDASATSPWWVNAAETGFSLIVDGTGAPGMLPFVTIPPASGTSGSPEPTGIVFNIFRNSGDFKVAGSPSVFLFASIAGTIAAWQPGLGTTAANVVDLHAGGAVYTGLAIGQIPAGPRVIYAANFAQGRIDIFDTNFVPVNLGGGTFVAPAGYSPFNVQNIGGSIFVAYAIPDPSTHEERTGPGLGAVVQYTQGGQLIRTFQQGPWLNAPWGFAMAPSNFGELSNRLLVGQFGSGQIASYDPSTGQFKGLMLSHGNHPVEIEGLWGIKFGNGGMAGPTNSLFFAAGIEDEEHGLFGTLTPKHADKEDKKNQD